MSRREEFLATFAPMQRAKAEAALDRQMRFDGRYCFRGTEVERRIAEGCTVMLSRQGERRLAWPNGVFLDEKQISKTAMDYAEFLIAQRI